MTTFRECLTDNVIRAYGFEHEATIAFASLCETLTPEYDEFLEWVSENLIKRAIGEE